MTRTTCSNGEVFNPSDNTCSCPPTSHLVIGGNCVTRTTCASGEVFNEADNTCSCPPTSHLVIGGNCVTRTICPSEAPLDDATNTCQCSGGKEFANNTCNCPSTADLEIDGTCMTRATCTGGKELDTSDNTCNCPSEEVEIAGTCEPRATCTDDKELDAATNTCVCSSTDIEIDGTCVTRTTCTGGKELNTSDNTCACPSEEVEIAGTCEIRATCTGGTELDAAANRCNCPVGEEINANGICIVGEQGCQQAGEESITVGAVTICSVPLPDEPEESLYTADTCKSQGWEANIVRDTANTIAELCSIAFRTAPQASARTSETETPLQLSPNTDFAGCIIRNNPGYQGDFPGCVEAFVDQGFPMSTGERLLISSTGMVVQQPSSGGGGGGGGGGGSVGAIIGVLGGVGLLTWLFLDGDPLALNFTPHAEMRHNNGVNYYAYGSKVDYAKDNWAGYWQAAQIRSGDRVGDWIYGTGTSWTNHVFAASMVNTTGGTNSDTAFSLSARAVLNTWTVESAYIADWSVSELTDNTWRNRLSLGASVVYEQWTITPKAELSWQAEDNIGDNARLRFDLSRDL